MKTDTEPKAEPLGIQLGDVEIVAAKYHCSDRTVYRLADRGLIPWGIKIGGLRRWNLAVIDQHIEAGCPRVRSAKAGKRR